MQLFEWMAHDVHKALQQTELKTSKQISYGNVCILDNRLVLLACLAVLVYMMMPNYTEQNDGWE